MGVRFLFANRSNKKFVITFSGTGWPPAKCKWDCSPASFLAVSFKTLARLSRLLESENFFFFFFLFFYITPLRCFVLISSLLLLRLNSTLESIELVVVGKCGCAKSSFLESLLDIPLAVSRKGNVRALVVHLFH
jgi:hypothetical protein